MPARIRKRVAGVAFGETEVLGAENMKLRRTIADASEEFMCPITASLFLISFNSIPCFCVNTLTLTPRPSTLSSFYGM